MAKNTSIEENTGTNVPIVRITARHGCPYCDKVVQWVALHSGDVTSVVQYIDDFTERTQFYRKLSEQLNTPINTVPQIWINGEYVGGCDQFMITSLVKGD